MEGGTAGEQEPQVSFFSFLSFLSTGDAGEVEPRQLLLSLMPQLKATQRSWPVAASPCATPLPPLSQGLAADAQSRVQGIK